MAESNEEVKRKFPKGIIFVLALSLFERVSSIGNSSILLMYLYSKLQFDQATSTALYHSYEFLSYFFPIVGAILAESYFGMFNSILAGTLLFSLGTGLVAVSAIEPLNFPVIPLTMLGLFFAVMGVGSIRGCVTAFGGNQYKLPEEASLLQHYFAFQVIFIKFGALTSRVFSPVMRQDVKCFGADDCYPFAFGFTATTMFLGFLTFLAGNRFYTHRPITENIFKRICGCVVYSLKEKFLRGSKVEKNHWLDYGETKYGLKLVDDTKKIVRILKLFIPIPVLWAVYMQQSSRWIFQATRMNGDLGFYKIKPDQMIALNPIISIISMPFYNPVFIPLLSKVKLGGLLGRVTFGGYLMCFAFILAILVELKIQENYISMLWLIPQWAIVSLSENFFFVALLNFTYTEGPENMKSVMTACVFTTVAIGNLIVTIISGTKLFSSQVYEFLFFVVILFIAMTIFSILAVRYRKAQSGNCNVAES